MYIVQKANGLKTADHIEIDRFNDVEQAYECCSVHSMENPEELFYVMDIHGNILVGSVIKAHS